VTEFQECNTEGNTFQIPWSVGMHIEIPNTEQHTSGNTVVAGKSKVILQ